MGDAPLRSSPVGCGETKHPHEGSGSRFLDGLREEQRYFGVEWDVVQGVIHPAETEAHLSLELDGGEVCVLRLQPQDSRSGGSGTTFDVPHQQRRDAASAMGARDDDVLHLGPPIHDKDETIAAPRTTSPLSAMTI